MKQKKRQIGKIGDVIQFKLPNGRYAYGRLYSGIGVAIYRRRSDCPRNPPIGSRDFLFHVFMYRSVITNCVTPIVGHDPFLKGEDVESPRMYIKDMISGKFEIYHKGKSVPATRQQCKGLERAAVWDYHHIVDRIMKGKRSKYLKSMYRD
jgi:hypothetical protein